jgi:uncharacterized membrane protein YedE/YeeE
MSFMEDMSLDALVALLGFGLGLVFGATALRANFCTMGAISDMVFIGDLNRFRAWMLAIAVAVLGSQTLHLFGAVDLGQAIYLLPSFGWAGNIIGGVMFGFGMTLAGGCGNKTLVRLGAGNLKSLVVAIILGIFAYMTLRGLIGLARVQLEAATSLDLSSAGFETQGLPELVAGAAGLSLEAARWMLTLAVAGALLWFCFKSAAFRASPRNIAAGLIIGALIPLGWIVTGVIGHDDFEPTPLASFTFVAPTGESLVYLMTFTGATINFGIATIGGVVAGSFLMAMATRSFHIESFTGAGDMVRHIVGGALMGTGGVMAMGCTIGQGITGMSTLALGSVVALLSIIAGGLYGMKYLEEGSFGGAFRAILARG